MTLVLLYGRIIPTDPAMPLNFGLCTTRRAFLSIILFYTGVHFMQTYPKNVLSTSDLLQKYIQAGMTISDFSAAETKLNEIGYYRLRGYSFHLYDPVTKQFKSGITFDTVLNIYRFDAELRKLLFDMTCQVEIALHTRFCEAMLLSGDPLAYLNPLFFKDKAIFWRNTSSLSSEIARSTDVFISHNYTNHDGQIPIWAAVEVMSFGTLSKYIKNLSVGSHSIFRYLSKFYSYKTSKGNLACPNQDMLTSWIHAVVVLRNICAHNSRIYNRSLSTKPKLLKTYRQNPQPRFCGLYHFLLAMKYLRPSDTAWNEFAENFRQLLQRYRSAIDPGKLHLPADWQYHI